MEDNLALPLGRLFSTILVLALTAGCTRGAPASTNAMTPQAIPVKIAAVESGAIDKIYDVPVASLESRRSVTLQPQIEGQITNIFVKYGDRVAAGAPIMQVDPAKQQASVNSYQAATESARADIENTKATLKSLEAQRLSDVSNLQFNQQQYERYATLYRQGAVPRQSLDQYQNSLQAARATLASTDQKLRAQQATISKAQRELQQSQANVKQQQVQLQYYKITAPFAGTVGDIPVKMGDYVNTSTKLTTINQNQPLEVNMSVPLELASQLRLGMPVRLLDEQGKVLGNSQVFFISPNTNNQTQTVLIKALFENPTNQLRANGFVHAQVILDNRPGVLVPTTAVSRLAGKPFVFVAQQQGESNLVAKQKPVTLGEIRGNNYQVLEGLQPGEKVIVSGIIKLSDGSPIKSES